ncbi:MAG: HNH endonuclease [Bacteroidia bacterium]
MKFFIGVTDTEWFKYLTQINPEDVNFWQPGGKASFKVIGRGAPFLFKLKSPLNAIGGVGFFSTHSILPISMAWEIFGNRNGAAKAEEFYNNILRLRHSSSALSENPNIGCIVLTNPVFFKKEDWVATPPDWGQSIVQGKSYSTEEVIGNNIWKQVEANLFKYGLNNKAEEVKNQLILEEPEAQYGKSILTKVRLGQGAFRVLVTDAYTRKCTISGERTLPVLEAAHIKPYAEAGPHFISNGLLLRSDIHKLFDTGYITITKDLKVEVSRKIKEEYENGRDYYKFHGNSLINIPSRSIDKPSHEFIEWHNNIFKR